MNLHTYNIEESKALYQSKGKLVETKECYSNIFKVLIGDERFLSGKWKVAYGYISLIENLITRHCFIVNEEGEAIDPTFYKINPEKKENMYASFKLLEEEEYQKLIEENNYIPDLIGQFKKEEREAAKWAMENGYIIIG